MKTFELCFLGNATGSYKFRTTQVMEAGAVIDQRLTDLSFKKPILKGMTIGDYILVDTDDENSFKNWRYTHKPAAPLADAIVLQFSIEHRAKLAAAQALKGARKEVRNAEAVVAELRGNIFMLNRSERAAFAMWVFNQLTK